MTSDRPARTFRDPRLEWRFRRTGWAVVPGGRVGGATLLDALRGIARDADLPSDRDFYATCNDAERDEARRVDLALKSVLGPAVGTLLRDHAPFLAAFVTKGAATGASMAFHQDLSYVDERHHRSVMAWIPLVDVGSTSGALEVVDGSHRWTSGVRPSGTGPLATAQHQDAFRRRSRRIDVGAGDVVLFDHALVHGSAPNDRDLERTAAVVAFAPRREPLVIGHREGDGPLEMFVIDESFFTTRPFRSRPDGFEATESWGPPIDGTAFAAELGR